MQKDFSSVFSTISRQKIDKIIEEFDAKYGLKEKAVAKVFEQFKKNTDESEVLVKVTVLNTFYSTQLKTNPSAKGMIDVESMAKHIASVAGNSNLDRLLYSNDEKERYKAVRLISEETSKHKTDDYNKVYSFATKYCSWHNPEGFPIVDRFSKGMLYYMQDFYKQRVTQTGLGKYDVFCEVYEELKKYLEKIYGERLSLKTVDKFLWLFGRGNEIFIS